MYSAHAYVSLSYSLLELMGTRLSIYMIKHSTQDFLRSRIPFQHELISPCFQSDLHLITLCETVFSDSHIFLNMIQRILCACFML